MAFLVVITLVAALGKTSAIDKGPPRLTDNYQRRYVAATGGTIRLTCPIAAESQDSGPAPLYDWTKDGREIHAGWPRHKLANGTLKIKDVDADDAGVYRCQATNGFGSARASLFMQVTDVADQVITTSQATPAETANISEQLIDVVTARPDQTTPVMNERPLRCSSVHVRNSSVPVGGLTVMHCELQCNTAPIVQWLKQIDATSSRAQERSFYPVNGEVMALVRAISQPSSPSLRRGGRLGPLGSSMYVSRLTFEGTTTRNGGMYVCVSVDQNGQRSAFGTGYLTVVGQQTDRASSHFDADRLDVISDTDLPDYGRTLLAKTSSSLSVTFVALISAGLIVVVVIVLCCARRRCHSLRSSQSTLTAADKMYKRRHLAGMVEDRSKLVDDSKNAPPYVVGCPCPTVTTPSSTTPPSLLDQQSTDVLAWPQQWSWSRRVPRDCRWSSSMIGADGVRPLNGRSTRRLEPVSTPLLLSWYFSQDGDFTGFSNNGRHNVTPISSPLNIYEV